MREIRQTSQFRSDLKRIAKSGRYKKDDLLDLLQLLSEDQPLPPKNRDHALAANGINIESAISNRIGF
jgi:mRNA interferase YafQ